MAQFAGRAHWAEPSPLFALTARPSPFNYENRVPGAGTREGNSSPGSSRLYRLDVSQAHKAEDAGNERPRLRLGEETNRPCWVDQVAGNAYWAEA